MDTTKSPHGVYKNPRLMHVCTTIVGFTVHLQTKDGQVWEGIFNTFSEEFTVCLDLAVPIDPKVGSKDCLYQALKSGLQAKRQVFFDLEDIVRISVVDVDLNYATKELDKITTDADISGFNSSKLGETRELESWQDDDGDNPIDDSLLSLDEVALATKNGSQNNSRTGWDPTEMFRYNEKVHKVSTTYDEKLHDYTIALPKHGKNDRDWRKKQERAAAIAREIESNPQSQVRVAKEDGSDNEEEKFSAVVRPTSNQQQPAVSTQPEQNQQSQPQRQPNQLPNNGAQNKNFRRYERRLDSLKNFGKSLTLAPPPSSQTKEQSEIARSSQTKDQSEIARSPQTKDQSEIARKSKLNPNAKEFVYKPRSPAVPAAQTSGTIDPTNPSPMSQATHGPYYQQVPIFPHGLSPHQQPPHATQFMPNHAHMHAFHQSQIHYMPTPMAPHFAPQQMSPRYIRSNFQNYHHRGGEHLNNVRAAYPQAMVAPTSVAGQQYAPPQSGAPPHPMSGYATASPQQQMIYSGPPHTVYPMYHVPNPPAYDANAVYMQPSQNY